jgi:hypothetical protein
MCIVDVLFYFYLQFGNYQYPLAMLNLFSLLDEAILSDSSGTVYLCEPLDGPAGIITVPITTIHSVVSMFPEMEVSTSGQISKTGKFSMMCHAFIKLAMFLLDGLFNEDYDT